MELLHSPATARSVPFALYIAFLVLAPLVQKILPGWDSRWFYAVQIGAVMVALAVFSRSYVELFAGVAVRARDWALTVGVGIVVFIAWINLDLPWATLGETQGFAPTRGDGTLNWALVAVRIFGAAAVVPIMEELFWRSFILRWIDRSDFLRLAPAMVSLRALLISSLLFGVEHDLWLAGLLAGLAYAWLYMRSGSLWPPIAAHALTNLLLGLWVVQTNHWKFW
ncbi:MAG: CAAX prenyl protease-related protein [Rugosibacter sp.]|nr:CAAX prenyl protease-related protein [Rugosibacter sp.]